ncbi:hypothetical protein [Listeria fleischmannii]|uniref:Uncharacterized protein n=1 Tax=Listeria fleischmannii FSL S10-1203 TaxID=1265822 RepID=W7D6N6_9LIST|nr:hypothetical protein [Listeria fleischmannii]EUJ44700.1 hypothetical protein MCOL2_19771 [Listeria fleischmannii FSL S10-1203]
MNSQPNQPPRITMYVVTNMMVFERKVYQFFGIGSKRAFKLRSLLYFLGGIMGMAIWRHLPLVNGLVTWIPFMIAYIAIPVGIAYLIGGVYTENRNSLKYFRSFFMYLGRKQKGYAFYGGKLVKKPQMYDLRGTYVYQSKPVNTPPNSHYHIQGYFTVGKSSL